LTVRVFTNGCFDIIHRGHIELLKYCKTLGDVTVGLNSDNSVRGLKGESRPVKSESERKLLLESLRYVDEVIIFDEETPQVLIERIQPDIIVKGGDYKARDVIGRDIAEVRIFQFVNGFSTTETIRKIQQLPD